MDAPFRSFPGVSTCEETLNSLRAHLEGLFNPSASGSSRRSGKTPQERDVWAGFFWCTAVVIQPLEVEEDEQSGLERRCDH